MKHRKIKSEIAFYLQNFDQIEYHEYVDRQTRDFCRKIEKESVNKQHTDYFLNYYVPKVKIYDILSNDGMTKLVNSLYKLSHQKYKVFNVLYRKPTILHKYDYVHMQKETSVYKGYKQDKIEMRGDRAEMSDFPLYLNTVAGGLDRRDQTIGGFSFVVKIYAVPVVEIIG